MHCTSKLATELHTFDKSVSSATSLLKPAWSNLRLISLFRMSRHIQYSCLIFSLAENLCGIEGLDLSSYLEGGAALRRWSFSDIVVKCRLLVIVSHEWYRLSNCWSDLTRIRTDISNSADLTAPAASMCCLCHWFHQTFQFDLSLSATVFFQKLIRSSFYWRP